jgi:hypothetical protein
LFNETPKYDAFVDIYAFGATLYEMVMGKKMIAGDTAFKVITKVTSKPIPQCELPGRWKKFADIINKMTQKSRRNRYQSIDQALLDLKELKVKTDLSKTLRTTNRQPKKRRSNFSFFIFSSIGLLVLFGFILLPWSNVKIGNQKNPDQQEVKSTPKEVKNVIKEETPAPPKNVQRIDPNIMLNKIKKQAEQERQERIKRQRINELKSDLANHKKSVTFRNAARALDQSGERDYVKNIIKKKLTPYWLEKHYDKSAPLVLLEMSAEFHMKDEQWEEARKNLHTAVSNISQKLKPMQGKIMKLIGEIKKDSPKAASAVTAYSVSKIILNKGAEFDVNSAEFQALLQKIKQNIPHNPKLPKRVKSLHAKIASLYLRKAVFLMSRSKCHIQLAIAARNKANSNIDTKRQKEVFRHHHEYAIKDVSQALNLHSREQWKEKKREYLAVQKP